MRLNHSAVVSAVLLPVVAISSFVRPPQSQACREVKPCNEPHRLPFQPLFVAETNLPRCINVSVLEQVYPSLLKWRDEYGHPNIPLGTPEGRMCQTLRRLQIQQKLSDDEVKLLEDIGFRFASLEDVYHEFDFDAMLEKLVAYEQKEQNNYQVPKKYAADPELGAWVTGIRRVMVQNQVDPHHMERLDAIGFSWISERKCGSKFMSQYRELVEQVEAAAEPMKRDEILNGDKVQTWIAAQREVRRRGGLSDTRFHYMQQLLGDDWMVE